MPAIPGVNSSGQYLSAGERGWVSLPNGKKKLARAATDIVNPSDLTLLVDDDDPAKAYVVDPSASQLTSRRTTEFIKTSPRPESEPEIAEKKFGNIQILFSFVREGIREFWMGGDRPPVKLVEINLSQETFGNYPAYLHATAVGENFGTITTRNTAGNPIHREIRSNTVSTASYAPHHTDYRTFYAGYGLLNSAAIPIEAAPNYETPDTGSSGGSGNSTTYTATNFWVPYQSNPTPIGSASYTWTREENVTELTGGGTLITTTETLQSNSGWTLSSSTGGPNAPNILTPLGGEQQGRGWQLSSNFNSEFFESNDVYPNAFDANCQFSKSLGGSQSVWGGGGDSFANSYSGDVSYEADRSNTGSPPGGGAYTAAHSFNSSASSSHERVIPLLEEKEGRGVIVARFTTSYSLNCSHSESHTLTEVVQLGGSVYSFDGEESLGRLTGHARGGSQTSGVESWEFSISYPGSLPSPSRGTTLPGLPVDPTAVQIGQIANSSLVAVFEFQSQGNSVEIARQQLSSSISQLDPVVAESSTPDGLGIAYSASPPYASAETLFYDLKSKFDPAYTSFLGDRIYRIIPDSGIATGSLSLEVEAIGLDNEGELAVLETLDIPALGLEGSGGTNIEIHSFSYHP